MTEEAEVGTSADKEQDSYIHKHLLNTLFVPGTVLGAGYTKRNEGCTFCPPGISNPFGKRRLILQNRTASDTKGSGS